MKQQIHQARWIGILAATGIALYLCWLMLRPFITVLEWAAVLVIVFYPVHKRLAQRIKRRGLSALISSLMVIVVLVVPLTLLTIALANELAAVAGSLPELVALMNSERGVTGTVAKWIHDHIALDGTTWQALMTDQLKIVGASLVGQSLGIVGNMVSAIARSFFVIITMYYLFRDGDRIVHALPTVLPLHINQSEAIFARVSQVVSASVYGVVSIAMLQGLLGGLAFWALGVPSPILWGIVLAFVCMIPIAGSFFVWLPASAYLMLTGHWTKGILLIIWGALVISTVDNFLRPKLIKNQTKLHELFVFFSVLGGMSVFGLLGIVLGPVVLAITLALLDTFRLDKVKAAKEQTRDLLPMRPEGSHPTDLSNAA